jgi:hypothetical protein
MDTDRRVFDWSNQEKFARLSCDWNPIHMDTTAARRTHFGVPIVHGIHSLIWALECFASRGMAANPIGNLKVQFLHPIYVGDEVVLDISQPKPQLMLARASVSGEEVLIASFATSEALRTFSVPPPSNPRPPPMQPAEPTLAEMASLHGSLSFSAGSAELGAMFPNASAVFGAQRIAALACSSCLVGMLVPGLHSLYSGLDLSLSTQDCAPAGALQFAVESVVERFRLIRIAVAAQGIRGSLETVNRPPPVRQPGIDRVTSLVSKDEFRDCVALIVGGSRGLGELTAKLIAAGGGRVVVTYASGKLEAEALARELTAANAQCTILQYDVRRPAAAQLAALTVVPTQLYYFATPPIFQRKAGLFDEKRFTEFSTFYVSGFYEVVQACPHASPGGLRVFYPSSTALDERPSTMTEYSMAKAAAETLCADLSKFVAGMHIMVRRLPRLPTDQTSSVMQGKTQDPIEVLLPIVRQMQALPLRRNAA